MSGPDDSGLDSDLIHDPLKQSNIKVEKEFTVEVTNDPSVIPNADITSVSDGPLGANIPNELPDFDAKFKLVQDGATKVVDYKTIENMLLGEKKVGQDMAAHIEEETEGALAAEDLAVTQYTKEPSTVNFAKTVEVVKAKISRETETLNANASTVIAEFITAKIAAIAEYATTGYSATVSAINSFRSGKAAEVAGILNTKNRLVKASDNSFVDIGKINLKEVADFSAETPAVKGIFEDYIHLSELLSKDALRVLIVLLKNKRNPEDYFLDHAILDGRNEEISFMDLVVAVSSEQFVNYLDFLYFSMSDENSEIRKELAELLANITSGEGTYSPDKIIQQKTKFRTLVTLLHNLDILRLLVPLLLAVVEKTVADYTPLI